MAKDPAFLFYPQDFITGTMFMTSEQVGIYIRLLCAQHQHGGSIGKIAFESMTAGQEIIRSKFKEDADGFYNERLLSEMGLRKKKSSNLSENANKRWEKYRKEKEDADAMQLHSKSSTKEYATQMPAEDEDENRNVVGSSIKIDHETFLRNLFAENETAQAHREALHLAARVEVTKDHARKFNASLLTESKHHTEEKEWRKHFRNWLTKGGHKVGYEGKEEATEFNFKLITKKQ